MPLRLKTPCFECYFDINISSYNSLLNLFILRIIPMLPLHSQQAKKQQLAQQQLPLLEHCHLPLKNCLQHLPMKNSQQPLLKNLQQLPLKSHQFLLQLLPLRLPNHHPQPLVFFATLQPRHNPQPKRCPVHFASS